MPPVKHQKLHMASHQPLQHLLPPHGLVHPLLAPLPLRGPEQTLLAQLPLLGLEGTLLPLLGLEQILLPLLAQLPLHGLVPLLLLLGLGHPLLAPLPLHGPVPPLVVQTCPPLEDLLLLPLPQVLQASFPACHLPQADTQVAPGCQDSFLLPQGSFLECTPHLLGLLRLPIPTCHTKGTCMALEDPLTSLLPQVFLEECFHPCPLGRGAHLQAQLQAPMEVPRPLEE